MRISNTKKMILALSVAVSLTACSGDDEQVNAVEIPSFLEGVGYTDQKKCYLDIQDTKSPVIPVLAFSYNNPDVNIDTDTILKELEAAVARGCDINEVDSVSGYRATETAVVVGSRDIVKFLLDKGANPKLTIEKDQVDIKGKNLVDLSEYLMTQDDSEERKFIAELVKNHK